MRESSERRDTKDGKGSQIRRTDEKRERVGKGEEDVTSITGPVLSNSVAENGNGQTSEASSGSSISNNGNKESEQDENLKFDRYGFPKRDERFVGV